MTSTSPTTLAAASSTAARTSAPPTTAKPSPTPMPTAIPPVSAQAKAAGLVDVRTVVPDAVIDLRYATTNNFTKTQLYPANARCLIHNSMAAGLKTAADALRRQGLVIVFWDCYRPHAVQVQMFQIVPNPEWVARPTNYARSHESARSVDVTLARAVTGGSCPLAMRIQNHCQLDMGTGFDDFTPRAFAFATNDVNATAQTNRALLRRAMNAGGITVYEGEWWHFDGAGSDYGRPILDVPVN